MIRSKLQFCTTYTCIRALCGACPRLSIGAFFIATFWDITGIPSLSSIGCAPILPIHMHVFLTLVGEGRHR
ncbi:hypothetical protein BC826DRAFT_999109 [Russula brevipes]|nr:hypothetical protein BC826DRAFT_999109 [Russula brevipes]